MAGVIGIVFNQSKDAILVLERCDVAIWVLPGGGIDPGETPEDAVIREVLEETGVRVEVVRKIAEYSPLNRLADFTHFFECRVIDGTPTTSSESRDVRFCSLNKLPTPFFHLHRDWIADAEQHAPHLIRKAITQVTYLKLLAYFCQHPIRVIRFYLSKLRACHH